jgi:hypothetical protein
MRSMRFGIALAAPITKILIAKILIAKILNGSPWPAKQITYLTALFIPFP